MSNSPNPRTALVIGATSSLSQAICRNLAKRGFQLVLTGRDDTELLLLSQDLKTRFQTPCTIVTLDMMNSELNIEEFFDNVGYVDDVFITVGDMGSEDQTDLNNLAYTAHVNYTVPAQLATEAAKRLEHGKKGRIVIISSVAGDRGRQSNYAYGSAKAALTTFASGLRNLFNAKDVHIMTVKPGFIDTPMTWNMSSPLIASREYVAEHIIKSLEKEKDVIYVPFFWRFIMLIIMHIPEKIFKRLSL